METRRAIATYRAVREFSDEPVPRDVLVSILEAGRRAPSSKNQQRWAFVACTDRDHLRELAAIGDFAGHLANAGAAIAIVTPETADASTREWQLLDVGQAAMNMLLAAWDLGLGAVHASVYDEPLARRLLCYPEGERCDLVLSLGYPADRATVSAPRRRGRRPLEDVVHWERW